MHLNDPTYFGKILLFGEYTVIAGGGALAMPLRISACKTSYKNQKGSDFESLINLCIYLENNCMEVIDTALFKQDLQKGLWFPSDIPYGYGAGSSGALVAAIYDIYGINKSTKKLWEIKNDLACIESYFHGSSSGFDPLISYMNSPLRVMENGHTEPINELASEVIQRLFLIDTGISRHTSDLVHVFHLLKKEQKFEEELIALQSWNTKAIESLIGKKQPVLEEAFQKISVLQWKNFQPMIHSSVANAWKEGLKSGDYFIKLCGSGGGGYYLGLSVEGYPQGLKIICL